MEKELKSILEAEHLEHLAPKFEEQGVTDEILDQLEDSDLRELGVEKLGEESALVLDLTAVDRGVAYQRVKYWVRQSDNFPTTRCGEFLGMSFT